jgi:hypothetical protein
MKLGKRIVVVNGKLAGKSGEFLKNCSQVFPDYCSIKLDLKGREKENKTLMILKTDIKAELNEI